jgi:hypothetical protein
MLHETSERAYLPNQKLSRPRNFRSIHGKLNRVTSNSVVTHHERQKVKGSKAPPQRTLIIRSCMLLPTFQTGNKRMPPHSNQLSNAAPPERKGVILQPKRL